MSSFGQATDFEPLAYERVSASSQPPVDETFRPASWQTYTPPAATQMTRDSIARTIAARPQADWLEDEACLPHVERVVSTITTLRRHAHENGKLATGYDVYLHYRNRFPGSSLDATPDLCAEIVILGAMMGHDPNGSLPF